MSARPCGSPGGSIEWLMASDIPSKPVDPKLPSRDVGDSVVLERRTQRTKPPQMYQVVMLNDDYTPMEFVVDVLMDIFGKGEAEAVHIMLKVHVEGSGLAGVYPFEIAETKVEEVHARARAEGHPLKAVMEEGDA